jgi:hypothetical protein
MFKHTTYKLLLLCTIVCFATSSWAKELKLLPYTPTTVSTGTPATLDSSASPETKMGCEIAADARLSLDSARGSCEAAFSIKNGGPPPADTTCKAPNTSTDKTQQQISQETGSACTYSQEGARCQLQGETIDNDPDGKTDCSGFATGVLLRSGALFQPGQKIQVPLTTVTIKAALEGSPCWTKSTGTPQAGDMCVYNNGKVGHVWFVDRTNDVGQCTRIESTGGKDTANGGISISKDSGSGCNGKEGGQAVTCARAKGTPECTDQVAKSRKYKNEDKVASCDVGARPNK